MNINFKCAVQCLTNYLVSVCVLFFVSLCFPVMALSSIYGHPFSGVFAKVRIATIRFVIPASLPICLPACLSVCLSVLTSVRPFARLSTLNISAPNSRIFMKFDI